MNRLALPAAVVALAGVLSGCAGTGPGGGGPYVYFVRGGNVIMRQDMNTGTEVIVLAGTGPISNVRLSPSRARMLYMDAGTLHVADTNGLNNLPITGYKAADWVTNTQLMVVSNANQIHTVNSNGTSLSAPIFSGIAGSGIAGIDVNPQMTKVLVVYGPTGWNRVFIMNPDGSGSTPLTPDLMHSRDARWGPGGTIFAFTRENLGAIDIHIMSDDGVNTATVATDPEGESQPAYRTSDGTICYVRTNPIGSDIWAMDSSGNSKMAQVTSIADESSPDVE